MTFVVRNELIRCRSIFSFVLASCRVLWSLPQHEQAISAASKTFYKNHFRNITGIEG